MKRAAFLLLLLSAGMACERMYQQGMMPQSSPWKKGPVYAPWREGLTLIYENPGLPEGQRIEKRLQLRVTKFTESPDSAQVVHTYTSLQLPPFDVQVFLKDGGVSLMEGQKFIPMLPEGFPDRVQNWEARNARVTYLGRAAADLHGLDLPDTTNPVGVWVEIVPLSGIGMRSRVFYLDGIGEVETLHWQDGRWISVNRLVGRRFT